MAGEWGPRRLKSVVQLASCGLHSAPEILDGGRFSTDACQCWHSPYLEGDNAEVLRLPRSIASERPTSLHWERPQLTFSDLQRWHCFPWGLRDVCVIVKLISWGRSPYWSAWSVCASCSRHRRTISPRGSLSRSYAGRLVQSRLRSDGASPILRAGLWANRTLPFRFQLWSWTRPIRSRDLISRNSGSLSFHPFLQQYSNNAQRSPQSDPYSSGCRFPPKTCWQRPF